MKARTLVPWWFTIAGIAFTTFLIVMLPMAPGFMRGVRSAFASTDSSSLVGLGIFALALLGACAALVIGGRLVWPQMLGQKKREPTFYQGFLSTAMLTGVLLATWATFLAGWIYMGVRVPH